MKHLRKLLVLAPLSLLALGALAAYTPQDPFPLIKPSETTKLSQYKPWTEGVVPGDPENNLWLCEPVFIFDCSGVTKFGRTHKNLLVYNNGLVSLAESDGNGVSSSQSRIVPQDEVERFLNAMESHGAWKLTDQPTFRPGNAMRSVTIFEGTTEARAHSFNYCECRLEYQALEEAVNRFIRGVFATP